MPEIFICYINQTVSGHMNQLHGCEKHRAFRKLTYLYQSGEARLYTTVTNDPRSEELTTNVALLPMLHIHWRLVWALFHAVFTQDPASIWWLTNPVAEERELMVKHMMTLKASVQKGLFHLPFTGRYKLHGWACCQGDEGVQPSYREDQ